MTGLFVRFKDQFISQLFGDRNVDLLHNVEAELISLDAPYVSIGRLWECRWSTGLRSITITMNAVPTEHDGTARLYRDGMLLAGLDFSGRRFDWHWVGTHTGEIPSFEPGQKVQIEVGRMKVLGTVMRK